MTVEEAVQRFRGAVLQKMGSKSATDDRRFHRIMGKEFHTLEGLGAAGRSAFEQLLKDESPEVRSWVAAQMLSEGDTRALPVVEQIRSCGGRLGSEAEIILREFKAGRLASPFSLRGKIVEPGKGM